MKNLQIEGTGLVALSTNELINYDAGHQGYAYAVGHFVGEAFQVIGTVAGVTALFLMPKS